MLNFQSMFIMADLGDETTVAGCNEQVLCVIRAAHDGSFDMTPGFSAPGQRLYHFEDDHGARACACTAHTCCWLDMPLVAPVPDAWRCTPSCVTAAAAPRCHIRVQPGAGVPQLRAQP
jgi:hypothetical protein